MEVRDFIANINDLYKPALNDGQMPFYSNFLAVYTDNQLEELWVCTMETHYATSAPSIGKLKEYAKTITKVRVVSQDDIEKDRIKKLTDEDIFSTELGRLSLAQGWADSYHVICKETGIPEQSDKIIIWFQRGKMDAENAARTLDAKNPFDAALINLRKTGVVNNQYWKEEFAHLVEAPHQLN